MPIKWQILILLDNDRMNSLGPECDELKKTYDSCFNVWFTEKFLKVPKIYFFFIRKKRKIYNLNQWRVIRWIQVQKINKIDGKSWCFVAAFTI